MPKPSRLDLSNISFTDFFKSANEAILIHDLKGQIVAANTPAAKIFGYSKKSLLGMRLHDLIADKKAFSKYLRSVASKGNLTFEGTIVRKNGKLGVISVNSHKIMQNKKSLVVDFIHDITERINTESEIKEREAALSDFIEGLPDAVLELDARGNFTRVNKMFESITGLSRKKVVGKSLARSGLISLDELPSVLAELKRFVLGEPTEPYFKFHILDKNKKKRLVDVNATLVKKSGKVIGVRAVARDDTSREKAQHAMKMFQELFENTRDAIFISTYPSMKIINSNRAATKLLGYKKSELVGKFPFEFGPKRIPKNILLKLIQTEVLTGLFNVHSATIFTKKKQKVMVKMVSSKFEVDGTTFVQTRMWDVGKIKKKDEELKRRLDELEKFHDIAVGREEEIVRLRKKIKKLGG